MANSAQARKRAKQAQTRNTRNVTLRTRMRTMIKKVRASIASQDQVAASEQYRSAVRVLDGMVTKGLMHRNTIARYKSRLNKKIKEMSAKS
jgi:small subunit ribosomal protein S20